jgi:hypothetical protein
VDLDTKQDDKHEEMNKMNKDKKDNDDDGNVDDVARRGEQEDKEGDDSDLEEEEPERRQTFPERLLELLETEDSKEAMWWLPPGDSFAIQPEKFSESILNKFFQGTKLESFTRKLNRW